jgi:Zn-dependent protease
MTNCQRCGHHIPEGDLACPSCRVFVHAADVARLTSEATELERKGRLEEARDRWRRCLPLVPPHSTQAEWIQTRVAELDERLASPAVSAPQAPRRWTRWLGPLAPLAVVLTKGKALLSLLKLNFLLSFTAFIGVYWAAYGSWFGIGFAVLILWHEMGHYVAVRRLGLPADMPVFLPGLGAYVRWQAMGVSVETRAMVSLAGPIAGLVAAMICAALWRATDHGLWAALARASAWLNALNLIPIWILDGGQASHALGRGGRLAVVAVALALWVVNTDGVFLLVAIAGAWSMFATSPADPGSSKIAAVYAALLVALASVMWSVPKATALF